MLSLGMEHRVKNTFRISNFELRISDFKSGRQESISDCKLRIANIDNKKSEANASLVLLKMNRFISRSTLAC